MPAAKLSPAVWAEIQQASEAGMEDSELSSAFGVSRMAIRQRKSREGWLTPRKIQEQAMIEKAKAQAKVMDNSSAVTSVTGTGLSAARLAELKEQTPLLIATKTAELIAQAFERGLVQAPKSLGELAIASKVFRTNAGLDQQAGTVVQIGMQWGGSSPQQAPTLIFENE